MEGCVLSFLKGEEQRLSGLSLWWLIRRTRMKQEAQGCCLFLFFSETAWPILGTRDIKNLLAYDTKIIFTRNIKKKKHQYWL
jgi:hypothetical protein